MEARYEGSSCKVTVVKFSIASREITHITATYKVSWNDSDRSDTVENSPNTSSVMEKKLLRDLE
jgi:hypothetical protein